jgi:hypothetical protein
VSAQRLCNALNRWPFVVNEVLRVALGAPPCSRRVRRETALNQPFDALPGLGHIRAPTIEHNGGLAALGRPCFSLHASQAVNQVVPHAILAAQLDNLAGPFYYPGGVLTDYNAGELSTNRNGSHSVSGFVVANLFREWRHASSAAK